MYCVRKTRGVSGAWMCIHWRVCWCGHCIVLVSTASFATPLLLIKHTRGRPTCYLTSVNYLGWKVKKMSQTGFYTNFGAALVKVGLKVWRSIFRPYVCFLPSYTAYVCLLSYPDHYMFKLVLSISKCVLFWKTWNSRQWPWRLPSSGMWHRVIQYKFTDVSE